MFCHIFPICSTSLTPESGGSAAAIASLCSWQLLNTFIDRDSLPEKAPITWFDHGVSLLETFRCIFYVLQRNLFAIEKKAQTPSVHILIPIGFEWGYCGESSFPLTFPECSRANSSILTWQKTSWEIYHLSKYSFALRFPRNHSSFSGVQTRFIDALGKIKRKVNVSLSILN